MNVIDSDILRSGMRAENRYTLFLIPLQQGFVPPSDHQAGLNCRAQIAILCSTGVVAILPPSGDSEMTQTSNRFFDEIGRLMNDAAGAAQGFKREVDAVVRNQAEKIMRDLDLVKREEFEAVKEMARLAREDNEALKTRLAALEARLGGG